MVTTLATCLSTYFAWQTVKLYSEQNQRESREELIQWATLLKDTVQSIHSLDKNESLSIDKCKESITHESEKNK